MQKIGDITTTADPQGEFTDGNVAQGVSPTILPAAWFNTMQRELVNTVKGAGLLIDPKNDGQILSAIEALIASKSYLSIYPIGIVIWFAQNKDPNKLFPGTTWEYIGEDKTIRLAAANGSDVMSTGGSDSVTLTVGNLPAHNHTFSANTSSFNYGTKTTSTFDHGTKGTTNAGAHNHSIASSTDGHGGQGFWQGPANGLYGNTMGVGDHSHEVAIGAHSHTVEIGAHSHSVSGTTANTGSGSALLITNAYIKLMAWYRSA
ncbi:phage baseplate protein [Serratia symbiotica]|uniref:phage baseplate protein n=1 Tax=Serratia symbiotica TaxID=138074 RepID=UPI001CF007D4|nr:phage tail protein [Serratia symbiotica]